MKKWRKTIRNLKDSNDMVAEIIGTVVLLGIVVAIFSTLYATVLSYPSPSHSTFVNLVATIEGNNIIIEHRGGQVLSLDTKVTITIGNLTKYITVGDENFLGYEAKKDNQWNVGERLVIPFEYNLNNRQAKITVMDEKSNSMVMIGTINITPESDIGIHVAVNNQNPTVGTEVVFTINVTNYRGDMNTTGVVVQYILPGGLIYKSSSSTQGIYDKRTGNWNVGELGVRKTATLSIKAKVVGGPTQLAILLDGSWSITQDSWRIMRNGLANAIKNSSIFPHNGTVELTIIRFGWQKYCANLEIGPVVVTNKNFNSIANKISNLPYPDKDDKTPMAAGIYLAADKLLNSNNFGGFNPDNRQIINLVTDGNPNIRSGPGQLCGIHNVNETAGKEAAKNARNYLINTLELSEEQDEFDVVAVYGEPEPDIRWLKNEIAWPQPGHTEWPPNGSGWVHYVQSWQDFYDSIGEQFKILFGSSITCNMKITFTTLRDPNIENNQVSITITTS